jgi:hypothetical protein
MPISTPPRYLCEHIENSEEFPVEIWQMITSDWPEELHNYVLHLLKMGETKRKEGIKKGRILEITKDTRLGEDSGADLWFSLLFFPDPILRRIASTFPN